jgi:hypothetical protein
MHSSFGRVDALFVIAMKDQPLLRDEKQRWLLNQDAQGEQP